MVNELLSHFLSDQATADQVTKFVVGILQRPEVRQQLLELVNATMAEPGFVASTNRLGARLVQDVLQSPATLEQVAVLVSQILARPDTRVRFHKFYFFCSCILFFHFLPSGFPLPLFAPSLVC